MAHILERRIAASRGEVRCGFASDPEDVGRYEDTNRLRCLRVEPSQGLGAWYEFEESRDGVEKRVAEPKAEEAAKREGPMRYPRSEHWFGWLDGYTRHGSGLYIRPESCFRRTHRRWATRDLTRWLIIATSPLGGMRAAQVAAPDSLRSSLSRSCNSLRGAFVLLMTLCSSNGSLRRS